MFTTTRLLAVLAATAAMTPAIVSASPVDAAAVTKQVRVQTEDLNLANAAGVRTLQARVQHAATEACGTANLSDPNEFRAMTSCKQAALANAQPQIDLAMARSTPRFASNPAPSTTTNTGSGS